VRPTISDEDEAAESLTNLDVRHLTQFIDEVRRCRPVKAFVYEDGTLDSNPLRSLQPVELVKERSDVVEPRRRKDDRAAASITDWSGARYKTTAKLSAICHFQIVAR